MPITQQADQIKQDVDEPVHARSVRWQFNPKLLNVSAVFVFIAAVVVGTGYWYQSSNIAASLMSRASEAGEANDWETQLAWLEQLQLLNPTDPTTALALANVAEKAIDLPPANRYDRVMRARNLMTEATALLKNEKGDTYEQVLEALERRLVKRELQFGLRYAQNIRRRVIALNAEKDDKELLRAFAIAKHTIARASETPTEILDQETEDKAGDFWLWLDQQPIPQILDTAWKANPQSIEIAARLASEIIESPDSFPTDGSVESALASQLAELRENGRAVIILHSLLQRSDATAATALLNENFDPALERLKQQLASPDPTPATETSTEVVSQGTMQTLPPLDPSQSYQPFWDFNLIIAWARENVQSGAPMHEKIDAVLDQLLALKAPSIPRGLIEDAYVLRVRETKDVNAAILDSVLLAGIERLGVDSPRLQLRRAARLSTSADLGNAKAAVQQLEETLQARRARLVGIAGTRLTAEQKTAEETQLATLTWSKDVLRGVLAGREGLLEKASQIFKNVLRSQVTVSNQQRLQATVLLADIYRRMAAWDLAATTYEAATLLSPERQDLRVLAAKAWTSAGNVSNAFAQWRTIEGNSPRLQLQQLRALIAEEIAKPPRGRNFESIWRRLDTLNAQLTTAAGEDGADSLKSELALLALAVPDRDDGSERKSNLQRLLQLADDSPNDARLQQVAAISLAREGKIESGRTLIQRLRQIEDVDSLTFTLANAKFEAAAGNLKSAINALLAFIENNPNEALEATTLAARYMASDNSTGRACEILQQIPPKLHTPESGFQLFSYVLATLPSPITSKADFSTLKKAEQLLIGLKDPTQTWWKLAKAIRLLTESRNNDLSAEESAELIVEAGQLSGEISAARPRWGLGLSLAGQVSAARGEDMAAIQSLQAGISNGDVRLSSSYLLTQLLLKMNRVAEAESEYSRFERLRQANSNIAAFGVSIAERKGDYAQSLQLARQTAESNNEDEIAWLLVAQAAMLAADATNDELAKADLLSETRTALEIALGLSNDTSITAYQMLLRFRAEFFDEEALRAELLKLSESKVSEPKRSLLSGRSYLQLKDPTSAFPLLKRAEKNAPTDPTVFVALSEYYQFVGDDQNTIKMLERAFQIAPNRVDIRNRLAIAIALRSGSDIPWQRLKSLLDTNLIGDSKNKLLHALILVNRGNKKQELQAEQLLQNLVRSKSPKADDARRLLASLLRKRWGIAASIDSKSPEAQRALAEARGVYLTLVNRDKPKPLDIYRLGDLLLRAEQTQDVTALADQLDAITKGSPVALDLRLRLAKQAGDSESVKKYTKDWANRAMEVDGLLQSSVWETAGQLLSRLGYHEESIVWLERAYRNDPEKFRPYVLGLTRARRFNEAITLCTEQYEADQAADTAAALADVAVLMGLGVQARALADEEEAVLAQALKEHPKNARLLEAIGTMRLAQERYAEAIPLYKESAKFAPDNVRLLNNLAMALSEIPNMEAEAVPFARKAIELYGRSPELLDTLGLVLARNNEVKEAEQVLREAVSASPDPRYRFHLLIALLKQEKRVEAISQWSQLDIDDLKKAALTPAERRDLNEVRQRFEG